MASRESAVALRDIIPTMFRRLRAWLYHAGEARRAAASRGIGGSAFVLLLELGEDAEVFQRRHVALHLAAAGELFQQAAHDFAAAGFGEGFGEPDLVGLRERADLLANPLGQFFFQR